MSHARAVAPTIEMETDALIGNPAPGCWRWQRRRADRTRQPSGAVASRVCCSGSVSQRVATHATCPVVVVRGRSRRIFDKNLPPAGTLNRITSEASSRLSQR